MTSFSERIALIASNLWGVPYDDIMRRNRIHRNVMVRQAVMHALRELKAWSFPQIGRVWGMDHTTVIHGVEQSKIRTLNDEEYAIRFAELMKEGERINDETFSTLQSQALKRLDRLAVRLYTQEVCMLAGFGPAKLRRRIAEGTFPPPVDRGNQLLFDRDAVLAALNLAQPQPAEQSTW